MSTQTEPKLVTQIDFARAGQITPQMKEVADLLGVHRTTLWRAMQKTDRLPNRKIVNTEQATS